MRPTDSIFQRAPLLRMVIMLILGIFVGDFVGHSVPLWVGLGISGVFLAIYLLLRNLQIFRRILTRFYGFLLMTACFMLGFYLVSAEKRDLVRNFPDGRVAYEAVLVSEPVVRGKVIQCELMAMPQGKKPFRLRASILRDTIHRRYERLHFGDGIRVFSSISQPEVVQRLSS